MNLKKNNWREKLSKVKADVKAKLKADYLSGKSLSELRKIYGITDKLIYKWVNPSDQDKEVHNSFVAARKIYGRPKQTIDQS